MSFASLGLNGPILQAVEECGYTQPTPIQAQAIPAVLSGGDLLAGAQTGTGKTAGFTLPMLQILTDRPVKGLANGRHPIRALVLVPTRELAAQVEDSVRTYGKHLKLTSMTMFGGVGINPQISQLKQRVDILVATPGRLLDHAQQRTVDLSHVEILVLDEADRMLDMGFIRDVKRIIALLPKSVNNLRRQNLLFSATFSDEIKALADGLLDKPKMIEVARRNTTAESVDQKVVLSEKVHKRALLAHLIKTNRWEQVLVFTRTKHGANRLAEQLGKDGITALAIHGNKSQSARTRALSEFKGGTLQVLVATDIAARGLDIVELPHVVNYELPNVPEDYVHRIGRTGRAGASGEAVSLVSLDEEGFMKEIEHFTRQEIAVQVIEGFGAEPDEQAEPIAMGRQTLWGGLGKPPSRDVMAAAARAARQEMMERIREKKQAEGGRSGPRPNRGPRPNGDPQRMARPHAHADAVGAPALGADGQPVASQGPGSDRGDRSGNRRNRNNRNRARLKFLLLDWGIEELRRQWRIERTAEIGATRPRGPLRLFHG